MRKNHTDIDNPDFGSRSSGFFTSISSPLMVITEKNVSLFLKYYEFLLIKLQLESHNIVTLFSKSQDYFHHGLILY